MTIVKTTNPHRLTLSLKSTERAAIRAEVFGHWILEEPGTPAVRNTYCYDVEKLPDGSLITLHRPTRLNKGADFVIHCENFKRFKNLNPKPPKHGDVFEETASLIARSTAHREELFSAMRRIWKCDASDEILSGLNLFRNDTQAARVLLLAKWFFIEQDVTYWTESGRHMLRSAFETRFAVVLM